MDLKYFGRLLHEREGILLMKGWVVHNISFWQGYCEGEIWDSALSLLREYFKHLGCYEVNYSNNRGILLFNIGKDCRACRKMKKEVILKHY